MVLKQMKQMNLIFYSRSLANDVLFVKVANSICTGKIIIIKILNTFL